MSELSVDFFDFGDSRFQYVKDIRINVFSREQGVNLSEEFDSLDSSAKFALLYLDGKPAATARIAATDKGVKIGRIAVLKKYRGTGLGRAVVSAVTNKAFDDGASRVLVDSQNYAVGFYQKLGFSVIGEEVTDRGLPHIPMAVTKDDFLDFENKGLEG